MLGIPVHDLRMFFQDNFKKSISDYINSYRLKEFTNLLMEQADSLYNFQGIADLAGFSSRATFYRVFKEEYNMTPAEFKQQLSESERL